MSSQAYNLFRTDPNLTASAKVYTHFYKKTELSLFYQSELLPLQRFLKLLSFISLLDIKDA